MKKQTTGSGMAGEIATYVMRGNRTPYDLRQHFRLTLPAAQKIMDQSNYAFGPGGKGYAWYMKQVGNVLKGGNVFEATNAQSIAAGALGAMNRGRDASVQFINEGVPETHQRKIAVATLKMSAMGAKIAGGMDHAGAVAVLKDAGWSPAKIAAQLKKAGHDAADIKKWMHESLDEDEKANARKMKAKGYRFIIEFPNNKPAPLYAKTLSMATEIIKDHGAPKGVKGQPIDKFLNEDSEDDELDEALGAKDKKVIAAFTDKKPMDGPKLSTDGETLDFNGMGGRGVASWSNGKIYMGDTGSTQDDAVHRAIRKTAPRNWIGESTDEASPSVLGDKLKAMFDAEYSLNHGKGKDAAASVKKALEAKVKKLASELGKVGGYKYLVSPALNNARKGTSWSKFARNMVTSNLDMGESLDEAVQVTAAYALANMKRGDRVELSTPQSGNQTRKGKAVMRGPHGWAVDLGGKHGTPGVATERNLIKWKAHPVVSEARGAGKGELAGRRIGVGTVKKSASGAKDRASAKRIVEGVLGIQDRAHARQLGIDESVLGRANGLPTALRKYSHALPKGLGKPQKYETRDGVKEGYYLTLTDNKRGLSNRPGSSSGSLTAVFTVENLLSQFKKAEGEHGQHGHTTLTFKKGEGKAPKIVEARLSGGSGGSSKKASRKDDPEAAGSSRFAAQGVGKKAKRESDHGEHHSNYESVEEAKGDPVRLKVISAVRVSSVVPGATAGVTLQDQTVLFRSTDYDGRGGVTGPFVLVDSTDAMFAVLNFGWNVGFEEERGLNKKAHAAMRRNAARAFKQFLKRTNESNDDNTDDLSAKKESGLKAKAKEMGAIKVSGKGPSVNATFKDKATAEKFYRHAKTVGKASMRRSGDTEFTISIDESEDCPEIVDIGDGRYYIEGVGMCESLDEAQGHLLLDEDVLDEMKKSKGHVAFLGDFEYVIVNGGEGMVLGRAPTSNAFDQTGNRHARFEAPAWQAEQAMKLAFSGFRQKVDPKAMQRLKRLLKEDVDEGAETLRVKILDIFDNGEDFHPRYTVNIETNNRDIYTFGMFEPGTEPDSQQGNAVVSNFTNFLKGGARRGEHAMKVSMKRLPASLRGQLETLIADPSPWWGDLEYDEDLDEMGQIYRIGAGGLKPIDTTIFLAPNSSYYLGASTTPHHIVVTAVSDSQITYCQYPYTTSQRIETEIGKDLIAQGTSRYMKTYAAYLDPKQKATWVANLKGKKGPLNGKQPVKGFQRVLVTCVANAKTRDLYGQTKSYGVLTDYWQSGKPGAKGDNASKETSVIKVARNMVPAMKSSGDFDIVTVGRKVVESDEDYCDWIDENGIDEFTSAAIPAIGTMHPWVSPYGSEMSLIGGADDLEDDEDADNEFALDENGNFELVDEAKSSKFSVKCLECGKKFKTASMSPTCPKCKGSDIEPDYDAPRRRKRNEDVEDELDESVKPTVEGFHFILTGALTQYDVQQMARAAKKRGGYHNANALGLYFQALERAEKDPKMRGVKKTSSDHEDLRKLIAVLSDYFDPHFPPIKKTIKQIQAFIDSGKLPKYPTPPKKRKISDSIEIPEVDEAWPVRGTGGAGGGKPNLKAERKGPRGQGTDDFEFADEDLDEGSSLHDALIALFVSNRGRAYTASTIAKLQTVSLAEAMRTLTVLVREGTLRFKRGEGYSLRGNPNALRVAGASEPKAPLSSRLYNQRTNSSPASMREDVDEAVDPLKAFKGRPRDWTAKQNRDAVEMLSGWSLKKLRKHQDLNKRQIVTAHRQGNTEALENLQAMENVYIGAIMRREVGESVDEDSSSSGTLYTGTGRTGPAGPKLPRHLTASDFSKGDAGGNGPVNHEQLRGPAPDAKRSAMVFAEDDEDDVDEGLGRKVFYTADGIGKAKYIVNFHDGKKSHGDGSPFYDIAIFASKAKRATKVKELLKQGYKEVSSAVHETTTSGGVGGFSSEPIGSYPENCGRTGGIRDDSKKKKGPRSVFDNGAIGRVLEQMRESMPGKTDEELMELLDLDEGGERFKKLEKEIAAKGDVRDPGAVAAAIGRKKYGKKKFQKMAAKGRAESTDETGTLEMTVYAKSKRGPWVTLDPYGEEVEYPNKQEAVAAAREKASVENYGFVYRDGKVAKEDVGEAIDEAAKKLKVGKAPKLVQDTLRSLMHKVTYEKGRFLTGDIVRMDKAKKEAVIQWAVGMNDPQMMEPGTIDGHIERLAKRLVESVADNKRPVSLNPVERALLSAIRIERGKHGIEELIATDRFLQSVPYADVLVAADNLSTLGLVGGNGRGIMTTFGEGEDGVDEVEFRTLRYPYKVETAVGAHGQLNGVRFYEDDAQAKADMQKLVKREGLGKVTLVKRMTAAEAKAAHVPYPNESEDPGPGVQDELVEAVLKTGNPSVPRIGYEQGRYWYSTGGAKNGPAVPPSKRKDRSFAREKFRHMLSNEAGGGMGQAAASKLIDKLDAMIPEDAEETGPREPLQFPESALERYVLAAQAAGIDEDDPCFVFEDGIFTVEVPAEMAPRLRELVGV